MSVPPELPPAAGRPVEVTAVVVRAHRAQTILILGVLGFVFAPFGFVAVWLGRKDLRAMAAGTMDRSGEQLTKLGRMLGIAAGIMWAIKWAVLTCAGVLVYLNWSTIKQHL
jgi:hypothetical protein